LFASVLMAMRRSSSKFKAINKVTAALQRFSVSRLFNITVMPSIPIDILRLILEHVDRASLIKICMLNKICSSYAQDVLYRYIHVEGHRQNAQVCQTLTQSVILARRVRSFGTTQSDSELHGALQNMTNLHHLRLGTCPDSGVLERCTFKLLSFACSFFEGRALHRFLLRQSSITDLEAFMSDLYDWPELEVTFLPNLTRAAAPLPKLKLLIPNRPVKDVRVFGYSIGDDDLSFLTLSTIPIQKLLVGYKYLYPKPGQFLASLVPSLTHLQIVASFNPRFNIAVRERPFLIDFNTYWDYYRVTLISQSGSKTYSLPWCHSESLGLNFILIFAVLKRGISSVSRELPIELQNLNTLPLRISIW
jgi:hypothetical protein